MAPSKLIAVVRKPDEAGKQAAGFLAVLRGPEFRLLWLADLQSQLGDQLARVALSVLVYERTQSALATAAVYALTFLPALFGSVLLGPLADRLPRRGLLVGGDLIRALLLAAMVVPGLTVPVLSVFLVLAVLVGSPWQAAETALVVDLLADDDYALGIGLRAATGQAAQLAGFALGGIAVAAIGPRASLGLDAATFAISALLIRFGIRRRPAAVAAQAGSAGPSRHWLSGAAVVFRDPRLRRLLALSWLLGLLVVPEGLAAPYAESLAGGPRTVGLLLASGPAGVLIGTVVYSRWLSVRTRTVLVGPLAAVAGLPLLACLMTPGLAVSCALWALSGACTAYQVQVVTEFVQRIAPQVRGQGIGLAAAGLLAAQGIGLLAAGAISQFATPAGAIAVAGGAAVFLGTALAVSRQRDPVATVDPPPP